MYCLFTVIYSYVIIHLCDLFFLRGFPGGASGKEPTCQCRRHKRPGFDPWLGKIPWSRKWQTHPVFLPGESHGQKSLVGYSSWGLKESGLERLSSSTPYCLPQEGATSSLMLFVYHAHMSLVMLILLSIHLCACLLLILSFLETN